MGNKGSGMTPAMLAAVADQFRVLSEPTRLALVQLLMAGERSVGELAQASGLSQASASKHLALLAEAGFLARRKEATTVYYSIADEVVHRLCELMCERVSHRAEADAAALKSPRRR